MRDEREPDELDIFAPSAPREGRPVRPPPSDPLSDHEAEVAVLGACLINEACYPEIAPLLTPEDFDLPKHGTIWEAFRAVAKRGEPVADIEVLAAQLRAMERLNTVGGAQYLGELTDMIPTGAHIRSHVAIVAGLARQRRLRDLLRASASRMGAPGADVDRLIARVIHELTAEGSRAARESTVCTAREAVKAASAQREATIERRHQNRDAWVGIPQPLPSLRRVMGGWMPKQMTVLSAGTSVGKTAFALQAAAVAAGAGAHVLIVSIEMDRVELVQRIIAAESSVSTDVVTGRDAGDAESIVELSRGMARVANLPFTIADGEQQSVGSILALCHALRAQGADLRLVIVDYLQLMDPDARRREGTREQEVNEIGKGLRALSKAANVHVLALSQENDDGRLRESRALEQHANNILKLRRESDPPAGEPCEQMMLVIEKQRGGMRNAQLPLVYRRATTTFMDAAEDFDDTPQEYVPGRGMLQ